MICQTIETREREGMYLFGIGIGEKRVKNFYKNADVLGSVKDSRGRSWPSWKK